VGEHGHQERLLGRPPRCGPDRARRDQHDARADATRRSPTMGRSLARSTWPPPGPRRRSRPPRPRGSTSRRSPLRSSARACGRSATPITSCSTASRAS
jgi:hypothetical protein